MKYEVTLKEIEIYRFEIKADTEDDAVEAAWNILLEDPNGKCNHHHDSDGDHEVLELDE